MTRLLRLAGAQLGPIQRADSRAHTMERLIALLEGAAKQGAELVVFPELAFTTFFPRWWIAEDDPELLGYFERELPGPQTRPLFDKAKALGVGFYIGYAELTPEGKRFNSAVTVGPDGRILGKYRKIHLPGSREFRPQQQYQQLEKRYFEYGDLGFPAFYGPKSWNSPILGMLVCNDRRWPEGWRVLGLQGAELVMVGYNSAAYDPNGGDSENLEIRTFHSTLVAQANAYMNACWAVAVAKAGVEDGAGLIGGSCIVDPNGKLVTQAKTLGDELILADVDFDACRQGKEKIFNFAAHRRPQWYKPIVERVGAVEPPV
ncbi:N-carbamoyl-D-amino-acid hydrolase [Siccirubricoccus phaeus]|uniref:N-carbamoyl-D-amino-acid hydrolase n=1 Tax=Siccirubricoccus phaeus TaxID=2595053 RepID=UPI0011F2C033|nr:N-carbamoyl-D-amino-acid hydrolase [Siccirubricoccus phaeus]